VSVIQLDNGIVPKPFNVDEYLSHFKKHSRRSRNTVTINTESYLNSGRRYAFFILDGSGSIGSDNFKRMKNFVAELAYVFQFCGSTGIMTYDQCAYLEYGFECFNNHTGGLHKAMVETIQSIQYPRGSTASGFAMEKAYDNVLSKIAKNASEIDVILITDGHSNTGKSPCTVANEIWNKPELKDKINVFPIGIGNVNHTELHCLMGDDAEVDNPLHVLNFEALVNISIDVLDFVTNHSNQFCSQFGDFQEVLCEYASDFTDQYQP